MKINKIYLDENDTNPVGLKEFKCNRFNHTIAFVGKNGSGKTRYLKTIENKLRNYDLVNLLNNDFGLLPNAIDTIVQKNKKYNSLFALQKEVILLQQQVQTNSPTDHNKKLSEAFDKLSSLKGQFQLSSEQIAQINRSLTVEINKRIKVISPNDFRVLKASFDSNSKPKDTFQDIIDSTADSIEINELNMISETGLSYLQRLPHKLAYDDIDTRGDEKKFKARVSHKRFIILKGLISEFLGKELEWKSRQSKVDEHDDHITINTTGYWTIDERELNYNDFSEGEKVLFTYALLLFLLNTNPKVKFKESIIIIDEPELNLHPSAQVKFLKSLQELIKDEGQLIIATHSLSIISNLDYDSIFLVRESEIKTPSSCIPYDSIDDLMGFDEHYHKMVEFLVSTPAWAMTNFMAQCFENPDVFEVANPNDPQLDIFKKLVYEHDKLSILDFGAGKGRLLDKIKESNDLWKRIEKYDCYDIVPKYNELLISKSATSVINDLNLIGSNTYDLIVLVNVLHEIPVQEWIIILNKLKLALNNNGFLAIIEDTKLPIGELPNENGFLLLDKEEFLILLGENTTFITPREERYKNRIICSLVNKEHMNIIDKETIIETLKKLKINSLNSIKGYRKQTENNIGIGRLFALKSNLYLNSDLAIESLNNIAPLVQESDLYQMQ